MVWTDTDIHSTFTDAALHILGVKSRQQQCL